MSRASSRAWASRLLVSAAALAGVCFSTNAEAIEFGAGLIGGAGGNFISKPDPFPGGLQPNPGFGGVTLGGGLALDLRIIPFFGLEVDILRKSDKGTGTYNNVDFTIGGGAWHVPLLLKGVLPSPLVAPFLLFGPEYVSPTYGNAEAKASGVTLEVPQFADSYWMLTFGVGMEVKLPLPILDLRIPVSVRGSVNPGASSKAEDRTRVTGTGLQYNAEWQYAIALYAGAQLYF